MDHYIDISVLPDPEFKQEVLMNALYAKLHRALGQYAKGRIGASFPKVNKTLGSTLRLHGTQDALKALMQQTWLQGLRDYTQTEPALVVPADVRYCTVKRVQAKSVYNKRKRAVAKGWLTFEQAQQKIPDDQQKRLTMPYAQIKSLSTDNMIRIYIAQGALVDAPQEGVFSSYGLSKTATVPWF